MDPLFVFLPFRDGDGNGHGRCNLDGDPLLDGIWHPFLDFLHHEYGLGLLFSHTDRGEYNHGDLDGNVIGVGHGYKDVFSNHHLYHHPLPHLSVHGNLESDAPLHLLPNGLPLCHPAPYGSLDSESNGVVPVDSDGDRSKHGDFFFDTDPLRVGLFHEYGTVDPFPEPLSNPYRQSHRLAHLFADEYADDHGLDNRESYDQFYPVWILDAHGDFECKADPDPDGVEFRHPHGLLHYDDVHDHELDHEPESDGLADSHADGQSDDLSVDGGLGNGDQDIVQDGLAVGLAIVDDSDIHPETNPLLTYMC